MSLDSFFSPASIALIGASPDRTKIRGRLFHLLRANGYPGTIYPINPSYQEIEGIKCYPTLAAVGGPIDLAIVAIPASTVPATLADCAAAGVKNAVIISSGFAEESEVQSAAQDEIAAIAKRSGMRILGPNTEGFHNEIGRVAANFSPTVEVKEGEAIVATTRRTGIVAQSGGMGFALYNRGQSLGLSFSYIVSTGNEVDLTAADFLDHMIEDEATEAVLLFLESVRAPDKFVAALAKAVAKNKPIVAIKIGRSGAGERASASHTASIAGWGAAYDAVFRTYGVTIAHDPDEAIAMLSALTTNPPARGNRVGIVTVSGGAGAWQADLLSAVGLDVPELSAEMQAVMRRYMPSYGSPRNPVDITAQGATTGGSVAAIGAFCASDEVDIVVVAASLASETRVSIEPAGLKPILAAQKKPVLISSYTQPSAFGRRAIAGAGGVIHTAIGPMANAARALVDRAKFVPPGKPSLAGRQIAAKAGPKAESLAEIEAKALLAQCGLTLPAHRLVKAASELDAAAAALGFPLAVKIQSRDILHKTEVGGVRLGITDLASLRAAYDAVLAAAHAKAPDAAIAGVLVEKMAPKGVEVIIGCIRDPGFGPVLMVGAGGTATELFKDVTYRLAPVDERQARAMLAELRSAPLLDGFRGAPKADVAALAKLIADVSAIAAANRGDIREIELNPVIVHEAGAGCSIADALVILEASGGH